MGSKVQSYIRNGGLEDADYEEFVYRDREIWIYIGIIFVQF